MTIISHRTDNTHNKMALVRNVLAQFDSYPVSNKKMQMYSLSEIISTAELYKMERKREQQIHLDSEKSPVPLEQRRHILLARKTQ